MSRRRDQARRPRPPRLRGALAAAVTVAVVSGPLLPMSAAAADQAPAPRAVVEAADASGATTRLTTDDLIAVVPRAVEVWPESERAGVGDIRLLIIDLPGDALAVTTAAGIAVDVDAGGHGWFVDPTPDDDAEFEVGPDGRVQAVVGSAAEGRMDLASVLAHEIGHVLGRGELAFAPDAGAHPVMADHLDPGERRLVLGYDAGADPAVSAAIAAGGGFHIRAAADAVDPGTDPIAPADATAAAADLPPAPESAADQASAEPAADDQPTVAVEQAGVAEPSAAEPVAADPTEAAQSGTGGAGTAEPAASETGQTASPNDRVDPDAATDAASATPQTSADGTSDGADSETTAAGQQPAVPAPAAWDIAVDPTTGALHFADDGTVTFGDVVRRLVELTEIVATGTDGDDHLTVSTESDTTPTVLVRFDGRGGVDTLTGPRRDAIWTVTGASAGVLRAGDLEIAYTGVERLVGADDTDDRFVLEGAGWVASVDGGGGGYDTLALDGGAFDRIAATVTGAQSGTVARDDLVTVYHGLEPVELGAASCTTCVLDVGDATRDVSVRTVAGSTVVELADEDGAPSGETHTYTIPTAFTLRIVGGAADTRFRVAPLSGLVSLYIDGGGGENTIVVDRDADMTLGAPAFTSAAFGLPADGFAELNPATLRVGAQLIHLINVFFAELTGGAGDNTFAIGATWAGSAAVDGGGGIDTLVGPDADADWMIADGRGALDWDIHDADGTLVATGVAEFTGIEVLQGGNGADVFAIDLATPDEQDGAVLVNLRGGGGANALVASDTDNEWSVTAEDGGTLTLRADGVPVGFVGFALVQHLVGGSGDDTFLIGPAGRVTGSISGGPADAEAEDQPTDTLSWAEWSTPVAVTMPASDSETPFTGTNVAAFAGIDAVVGGTAAGNAIDGPADEHVTWTVTGPLAGTVAGLAFQGFGMLRGASDNADLFIVGPGVRFAGTIHGGSGGSDTLLIHSDADTGSIYNPAGADASGVAALYGESVPFTGIDRRDVLGGNDVNRTWRGSIGDDTITVSAHPTLANVIVITTGGVGWYDATTGSVTNRWQFTAPTASLLVEGDHGTDAITIQSLSSAWREGAALYVYGNIADATFLPVAVDDPWIDTVAFAGDVATGGGAIEVWAERIVVDPGVTLDAADGYISFRARLIGLAFLENRLPVFVSDRSVSIAIGDGAVLEADAVFLVAQVEDRSLAEVLGAANEVDKYVIDPLFGGAGPLWPGLDSILSLPVSVLVKSSTASITVGSRAKITGTGGIVGLYATAGADAGASTSSSLLSIGYAQAKAKATVDIADAEITAAKAIVITADASASASMSASTSRATDSTPNPGGAQVALALAVAWADATATIHVATGAVIDGGRTVNIRAGGAVESEAEAESGMYADGNAALAFALDFSTSDISTTVDGTVIARMDPGSVVKIEIDPTVTENTDPATPLAERYPVGYVDYEHDAIRVGPHALATEDTITYQNRRGTSIGGLVDGREYYVLALEEDDPGTPYDESTGEWIKLAPTELAVLRAGAGYDHHAGNVVDLVPGAGALATANNAHAFGSGGVDAVADTIRIDRAPGETVFNPFSLGQAVIYRAGAGSSIAGLVDGATYYVVASTNEHDLQGDSRRQAPRCSASPSPRTSRSPASSSTSGMPSAATSG